MRKKFLYFIVSVSLSISTFASQNVKNDCETIIYGGDADFYPYEFINDERKPDGFNVELMNAICRHLHRRCIVKLGKWYVIKKELHQKKIDVVGMMYNTERAKLYRIGPTIKYVTYYAVFNGKNTDISSIQDLIGKKVIVETGAMSVDILRSKNMKCHLYQTPRLFHALSEVSKGRYDVMLCENDPAEYYLHTISSFHHLKMKDIGIAPKELCFTGNDDQLLSDIDDALYSVKKDGTYDKLYDKWFNQFRLSKMSRVTYIIVGSLLVLIFVLYFMVYMLKKNVNRSRRQLLENNDRLKLALSAGGIVVWGFDVKKRLYYNVDCNIFPPEGRSYEKEVAMFHPDDQQTYRTVIQNACLGVLPQGSLCFRIDYTQTGNWRYIEKEITVVKDENGTVTNIIGTHKDITEQRKHDAEISRLNSEVRKYAKQIKYVLQISHIITWYYDLPEDKITIYTENEQLYKTLSSEEYIALMEPEFQEEVRGYYIAARENRLESLCVQRKFSLNKESKEERYYVINGMSIKNNDGVITSYFGICNDVTNLIDIQHKLEKEMVRAQESDRLKSVFLANMSHEIRTPLNSIVGFSNLLESATVQEDKNQFVRLINQNSEMLLSLINDILDFSKLEAGTMDFHIKRFNLSDLFTSAYSSLEKLAQEKNIDFLCELPDGPCEVNADYNRLLQILTNFVTNAFKYTDTGYVKIRYEKENDGIKMIVVDTGIGIPKDKLDIVFQRFEKIGSLRQGTGLGLSICRAIVDMFKGKIGVESEVGKGSTFWAWLPIL